MKRKIKLNCHGIMLIVNILLNKTETGKYRREKKRENQNRNRSEKKNDGWLYAGRRGKGSNRGHSDDIHREVKNYIKRKY